MGLATEIETGQWMVSPKAEPALRELGERGDIIKDMHRALEREGLAGDRHPGRYVVHRENATERIVGRVLDKGLGGDEMGERVRLSSTGWTGACITSRWMPPAPGTVRAAGGIEWGFGRKRGAGCECPQPRDLLIAVGPDSTIRQKACSVARRNRSVLKGCTEVEPHLVTSCARLARTVVTSSQRAHPVCHYVSFLTMSGTLGFVLGFPANSPVTGDIVLAPSLSLAWGHEP
jgi:Protein of unknown function (DUF3363)